MVDTSIQENLRKDALRKLPSHRNWREWYALYDKLEEEQAFLFNEIAYLNRLRWWVFMLGISVGLGIELLLKYIYS